MKRVYIAGALSGNTPDYIRNVHRMLKTANEARKKGYAVFIPCLDFLLGVFDGQMEYEEYFDMSQMWLDVADAVVLTPGWENSKGTRNEIKRAKTAGIPVFYTVQDLLIGL